MELREIKTLEKLLRKYYEAGKSDNLPSSLHFDKALTKEVLENVEGLSEMIELYESEEN